MQDAEAGPDEAACEPASQPRSLPPPALLAGPLLLKARRLRPRLAPSTECGRLLARVVRVPASEQVGEPGKEHTAVGVAVWAGGSPASGAASPASSIDL